MIKIFYHVSQALSSFEGHFFAALQIDCENTQKRKSHAAKAFDRELFAEKQHRHSGGKQERTAIGERIKHRARQIMRCKRFGEAVQKQTNRHHTDVAENRF